MVIVRGMPPGVDHPNWPTWMERGYAEDIQPYGVELQLYHYVRSWDALMSIMSSRTLWASDARCLNDTTELDYGFRICRDALKTISDRRLREHMDLIEAGLSRRFFYQTFVACFSCENNLKGQWEKYADCERGFCVEFDSRLLSALKAEPGIRLMPVEYDPFVQRRRTQRAVARAVEDISKAPRPSAAHFEFTIQARFTLLAVELFYLCSTFKAWEWRHEREWRLVYTRQEDDAGALPVRHRARGAEEIPYVVIDLRTTYTRTIIPTFAAIRGGFRLNRETAALAKRYLLDFEPLTRWERQPPL